MVPVVIDDDSDEDDEIREIYREFQDTEEAGIPITIVMLVIATYVAFGAFLFRIWEVDWTPIDGAYFAVITISTIGFGDLVPGNGRFDQPETITELLIGALYCVVGLALLSMCFELMKEEFVDKVRWIGRSLHIVTNVEDNEMKEDVVEEIDEGATGDELCRDCCNEVSGAVNGNMLFEAANNTNSKSLQSMNAQENPPPKMLPEEDIEKLEVGHFRSNFGGEVNETFESDVEERTENQ